MTYYIFVVLTVSIIVACVVFLIREFSPKLNKRCVATYNFVKALTEKETPAIYDCRMLGYLHIYTLAFKEVRINLEYNDIRDEWSMDIWCYKALTFLFYHDWSTTQPTDAIYFLINKYGLGDELDKSLEIEKTRKRKSRQTANDIIIKTLQ